MGEVVPFPSDPDNLPLKLAKNPEELNEIWTKTRMMYCDELINNFFSKFAHDLGNVGFPVDEKDFFLRYITAGELMRSVLYDAYGLKHPHFQTVLDTMDKTKQFLNNDKNNPFIEKDDDLEDDEPLEED